MSECRAQFGAAKAGQAQRRQSVVANLRHGRNDVAEDELHFAGDRRREARHAATVRHMRDRNPGLLVEGRERQMRRRAVAGRGGIELAGLRLGELDQFLDGLDRQLRIGRQNQRVLAGQNDGLEIAQRLVAKRRIERQVGRQRRIGGYEQRVAVGGGLGDKLGANAAAGAGTIDDDDRLSPCGGESRAERAGQKVDSPSGRVGDDDLDHVIGIFGAHRRRPGDQKGGKCDAETAHYSHPGTHRDGRTLIVK